LLVGVGLKVISLELGANEAHILTLVALPLFAQSALNDVAVVEPPVWLPFPAVTNPKSDNLQFDAELNATTTLPFT
jgi:hypothetical protein